MDARLCLAIVAVSVWSVACGQSEPAPPAADSTAAPAPAPAVGPVAPPTTDEDKIKSALSAAPEAVSREAAVVEVVDDKGTVRTIRPGTNGWTCLPDGPSPGVDPMCLDKNGVDWAMAWLQHRDPPRDKMGLGYMLMGGSDASNADPFATAPPAGHQWVDTGPHLMVFNIGSRFDGHPTTHDNTKVPYVMWAGTPYAHLMIPVGP